MQTLLQTLCIFLGCAIVAPLWAQEAAPNPQRQVSVEVAIVELSGHGERVGNSDADADKIALRIKELQTQGKVAGYSKVRLSSVEGHPASAQFGERSSVMTGRMARGGGAPGGGPGGGAFAASYSQVDMGTLVQVVSKIDENGDILLELQVEKSGLARAPQAEGDPPADGAAAATPPKTVTITAKSMLRLQNGQTRVAYGMDNSSAKDGPETLILVTAWFDAAAAARAAERAAIEGQAELKVYQLKHSTAVNTAKVLTAVFREKSLRISADERTNSVIVQGLPAQLAAIEALLQKLDEEE